jgi:asparagine synthase (glutamine-hydrolysing)
MPGLIVVVQEGSENFSRNRDVVRAMAAEISHESFYRSQFFEAEDFGLLAARVYLDHEQSFGVACSEDGKTVSCVLAGELFGTGGIVRELATGSHPVRDPKNFAEMALRLYEREGEVFLEELNGCFSVLLVDRAEKKILVANDRFGMQALFCHLPEKGPHIFAPELKCFGMFPGMTLTPNMEALAQSFRFNCPLKSNTFFREVKRAPIASKFVRFGGSWSKGEYWTPEKAESAPRLPGKDFIEAATARFEKITPDYCEPGNTGLSFTGGWDTRAVFAVLDRKGVKLPCYTFGGTGRDSLDVKLARTLSERSGNPFHKLVVGEEFLRDFERWVNKGIFVSDGACRIMQCHEYYVNLLAREHGKVRLTGRFGSQILSGVRLLKDRTPDMRVLSSGFREICAGLPALVRPEGLSETIRHEFPQLEAWASTQGSAALSVRTPYMDNELVDLMLRTEVLPDTRLLQKTVVARNAPELAGIPTNRGDRIEMNAWNLPGKVWYKTLNFLDEVYNWEKLPDSLLPFCRFGDWTGLSRLVNGHSTWIHYRLWFAKELRDFVRGVLLDPETLRRRCWDARYIERIVQRHTEGTGNYTREIDRVLGFELWFRQNRISV